MSYTWIKLYTEVLSDPKMGRLPDYLWRRAVELFLLAGKEGNDGALPPVSVMGWELRLDETRLGESLIALSAVGVVHEAEPGKWVVTNFKKRQARMTDAERQRKRRAGDKSENPANMSRARHASVTEEEVEEDILTPPETSTTPPLSEKEIADVNRTVDGILKNEKRAKGKAYTQLPEVYIPYAREFSVATGLQPTKKDIGEWISNMDDWLRAGYQPSDVARAVREIVADGKMPITRPASITWKLKDISVKKRYEQPAPPITPPPSGEFVQPPRRVI